MKQRLLLVLLASICGSALTAQGQVEERSAFFENDNGWNFYAAANGGHVVGFLSVQVAGTVAANGFGIVWYERQTGGTYKMSGWTSNDPAAVAQTLNAQYGARLFAQTSLQSSSSCGVVVGVGLPVDMESGLALSDPLQPIAADLPPEVMEAAVELGAQGATQLSAQAVNVTADAGCVADQTAGYLEHYLTETEEWMFGQVNTTPVGACGKQFCVPGWVTLTISAYTWSPTVTVCANGTCSYSGTQVDTPKRCYENWDCTLSGCTTGTPGTPVGATRVCAPVGGACPPPPPPC